MTTSNRVVFASRLSASRRTVLGIALICLMALGGGAATAAGVLQVGSVIPGGDPTGPPENRLESDQTVLATGTSAVAGPYQVLSFRSVEVVNGGEVVQPADLPCIRLVLSDPPPSTPVTGSGFCGQAGKGGFDIANVPVRNGAGRVEVLLFGHAPEAAAVVQLSTANGRDYRVDTQEGPADRAGDVWVMAVPADLRDGSVEWLNEQGEPAGVELDASPQLDRGRYLEPESRSR